MIQTDCIILIVMKLPYAFITIILSKISVIISSAGQINDLFNSIKLIKKKK